MEEKVYKSVNFPIGDSKNSNKMCFPNQKKLYLDSFLVKYHQIENTDKSVTSLEYLCFYYRLFFDGIDMTGEVEMYMKAINVVDSDNYDRKKFPGPYSLDLYCCMNSYFVNRHIDLPGKSRVEIEFYYKAVDSFSKIIPVVLTYDDFTE